MTGTPGGKLGTPLGPMLANDMDSPWSTPSRALSAAAGAYREASMTSGEIGGSEDPLGVDGQRHGDGRRDGDGRGHEDGHCTGRCRLEGRRSEEGKGPRG